VIYHLFTCMAPGLDSVAQYSQISGAPYTLLPRTVLDITDGACSLE
jgi:hypothetical protein